MTEEQIERLAEKRMDRLDRRYIENGMSHDDYLAGIDAINREIARLERDAGLIPTH